MPSKDPVLRRIHARAAAYALHSFHDGREITRPARTAFMARFEKTVDPDGRLRREDPAEASRRTQLAIKAYYQLLAAKSVAARKKKGQIR
jgi:hypothetical protein